MTDIAKLAGVSQSTVSLVINHMSGAKVSKGTRETVLRIARELGYPVERHAHPAAARTRNLIVYLTDELTTSPHAMQTIDGARDAAWEHDCLLSAYATRNDPGYERAVLARVLADPALLAQVPTVLLNCYQKERRERL